MVFVERLFNDGEERRKRTRREIGRVDDGVVQLVGVKGVIRARGVSSDAVVGGKDDTGTACAFSEETHFERARRNERERLNSTFVAPRRYDTDVRNVFGGYEWFLWQVDDYDARAVFEEVGY